ncbi:hypothetical protein KP509_22G027000 [Ceratopteris richardii]|nr:hypothetical protein KP509_22G027000 [Ceratopteris richardii]
MLVQDVSHPRLQYALNLFSCLQSTGGLILNTCFRLEANAVTEFQARCPTYTVGPLFLPLGGVKDQKSSNWKENEGSRASDCLAWLDTQAASSVIYVSFGTLAEFSHEQIRELAWGLEMSHQPFLWVIHKSFLSGMFSDVLPQGFSERVKDRCFLTPWAPQLEVLTHRSIGGFFTHCGWNSILENITLSGVPMLCWPDKAEQGMNARLIVDVWKLGIPFKVSKECDISRDEVQAAVKNLMLGEGVQEMRRIGGELKQVVQEAVKEGGSSLVGLKDLVLNMKNKNSE